MFMKFTFVCLELLACEALVWGQRSLSVGEPLCALCTTTILYGC